MPALLTTMSSRPWRPMISPGSFSTAASSVTSRLTASAAMARRGELPRRFVRVVAARGGDHNRALLAEAPGNRAADAARRTGDERHFS